MKHEVSVGGMTKTDAEKALRILRGGAEAEINRMYTRFVDPHPAPVPNAETVRDRLRSAAEGRLQQIERFERED